MNLTRATLATCEAARETVVVIDVLRAFTTAAYAFLAGVRDIILVATVEEAFALKQANPELLLLGETDGLAVEGFDFSNSPSALLDENLRGATLVQRTSAGTQGVIRSKNAKRILVTGLCNASATVSYLERFEIEDLCLVETGVFGAGSGVEDSVCGDVLEALLSGHAVHRNNVVERVRQAPASRKFLDKSRSAFPLADLECAVNLDQFDFAMEVRREDERLVLKRVEL